MMEYDLEKWVGVVFEHQDLIPLKNRKLNRKYSYYQVSNFPEDVLSNYYFMIKSKIREEWIDTIYNFQDLIPFEDKKTSQAISYQEVFGLADKILLKYYLIITRKLGKKPLVLEPLSASEKANYEQMKLSAESCSKSDVDKFINGEIYANEIADSDLLGPREPNSCATIVEEAEELWQKIQQTNLGKISELRNSKEVEHGDNDTLEYNLEKLTEIVFEHQDLIPLENNKLHRKYSYYQVSNLPKDVLFNYYFMIKSKAREEWIDTVCTYQDLISSENKKANQEFSYCEVSNFDDKVLLKYYLIIMRKLGKKPLILEPLSVSEKVNYEQVALCKKAQQTSLEAISELEREVEVERDGNDVAYPEISTVNSDDCYDDFLGPRGPESYQEDEECSYQRSLHR